MAACSSSWQKAIPAPPVVGRWICVLVPGLATLIELAPDSNMVQRRKILGALTRTRLADLAGQFGLAGLSGKPKEAVVQAIAGARAVKTAQPARNAQPGRTEVPVPGVRAGRQRQGQAVAGRPAGGRFGRASGRQGERFPSGDGLARIGGPCRRSAARRGKPVPHATICPPPILHAGREGVLPWPRSRGDDKRPIEQYEHSDKTRVNNPPVGLVTPATDPDLPRKVYQYDPHLDPQLVWAGKAEHTSFEVPTVSLHVHERIDPRTHHSCRAEAERRCRRPSPNVPVRGARGEPASARGD